MTKDNSHKKILFVLLAGFLLLFFGLCSAAGLEVQYPVLSTGSNVTSQTTAPEYLKYVFDFGMFLGFVAVFASLVYAGVLYFLSPVISDALGKAKDRISGAISGLLILMTLYLIITTINPDLKFFRMQKLDQVPVSPEQIKPGVYFHKPGDCKSDAQPQVASIQDFGDFNNNINSVSIVSGLGQSFISIIYDTINYWGKCRYINPNTACDQVEPFANSASVYKYSFSASSDVYFYRKSFYDQSGGWAKIPMPGGIYMGELNSLYFGGENPYSNDSASCTVPKKDQDCAQYDDKGICTKRQCPSLANENIASIKINGAQNLLLLIYFDQQNDQKDGPWTFCQAFPTTKDVNNQGVMQVKWENIRQTGKLPNYVGIIPIRQ